jgi:hypothetical protein
MRIILPPGKWNNEIDGLDAGHLACWMAEFELARLPPGTLFPRPGQVWETVRDCDVAFEACIGCTGPRFSKLLLPNGEAVTVFGPAKSELRPFPFGLARLQTGERLRVLESAGIAGLAGPKPIGLNLQPLRYEQLQEIIIPQELRLHPGYTGYRLFVKTARPKWCLKEETAYLNEDFRLVEDVG